MSEHESITERTARHLQSLYVVGAGLGVGFALEGLVGGVTSGNPSMEWASAPVVVAYLLTLIPFFHGAMLYMDTEIRGRATVVLVDFLALFSQTVLFFVMAEFVREPRSFAIAWIVLLAVDVAWVVWLMTPIPRHSKGQAAEPVFREYRPWAIINSVCILVLVAVLAFVPTNDGGTGPDLRLGLILMFIALGRTAADYWFSRAVYFEKP